MQLLIAVLVIVLSVEVHSRRHCCTDPHERYTKCGPACLGDGCLITIPLICNQTNRAGCFCECGYFRDNTGKCIPGNECPHISNIAYPKSCPGVKCKAPFEYYTKSNACFEQCVPPGVQILCIEESSLGCYCLPGYKRNLSTGVCIPSNQCPGGLQPCKALEKL